MSKKQSSSLSFLRPSMAWAIYLFPCIAVVMAAYVFYDHFQKRGVLVKLHFQDAAGVEANKTPLRFRGINVGMVEHVVLTEDTNKVVVSARLDREANHLAVEGAKFYIVQPQVDLGGVSGLETLFKGPYIRIEQGSGKKKLTFEGSTGENNEAAPGTVAYYIRTRFLQSISEGDAVSYRGMKIGSVTKLKLDGPGQWVQIQINIEKKFVKTIRTNTMFWAKVGVDAKLGLLKTEIKINSFENLLKGGIDIATPNNAGAIAPAGHKFGLSDKPTADYMSWTPNLTDGSDKSSEDAEDVKVSP